MFPQAGTSSSSCYYGIALIAEMDISSLCALLALFPGGALDPFFCHEPLARSGGSSPILPNRWWPIFRQNYFP